MFTKEELDYIDRNLEINYREDHVDKDESSYYSIKVKLATLINKPVETTNEQPIDFNKLSKIKQELLLSCYYALQCIDDLKVKPLEIDIEEECAVTTRRTIEIRVGSIDFGVKVNNIDVIDKNIEW